MHVTDDKAYATLTDVKNKTGDVFALADEYGEVTITSYNKSKYLIKRISQKPVPSSAAAAVESTPSAELSELEAPQIEPVPEVVEAVVETVAIVPVAEVVPEAAITEPELQVTTSSAQPTEAPTIETGNLFNTNQIIGMFAGLGSDSMWDRSSKIEQNWTRHAHVLL